MTKWEDYEAEREENERVTPWTFISELLIVFAVGFFVTRLFL